MEYFQGGVLLLGNPIVTVASVVVSAAVNRRARASAWRRAKPRWRPIGDGQVAFTPSSLVGDIAGRRSEVPYRTICTARSDGQSLVFTRLGDEAPVKLDLANPDWNMVMLRYLVDGEIIEASIPPELRDRARIAGKMSAIEVSSSPRLRSPRPQAHVPGRERSLGALGRADGFSFTAPVGWQVYTPEMLQRLTASVGSSGLTGVAGAAGPTHENYTTNISICETRAPNADPGEMEDLWWALPELRLADTGWELVTWPQLMIIDGLEAPYLTFGYWIGNAHHYRTEVVMGCGTHLYVAMYMSAASAHASHWPDFRTLLSSWAWQAC